MSVKCTRDKQNEDSSFSIVVYPARPRATPTAPARGMSPAQARPAPATCATNRRPAPVPAPQGPRCSGTAGGAAGGAAGPRPGRAALGERQQGLHPSAERGSEERRPAGEAPRSARERDLRGLPGEVTASRTLRCKKYTVKNHQLKTSN